ncbi:MAG TPA: FAD-dependent monooxygenase [Cyclobacteriaceae bacterium]|nr:FAD-dependent monooxygenase [Cyclobacteriaceae bacterium]
MKNRILIIGGGIAGLTTALALQKTNLDFIVFEAVPEIKAVGAGISLAGNAMRALTKLGVDEEVKRRGHLISSMIIEDDKGKRISIMDAEKLSREYGLDNVAIHRADLHQVLLTSIDTNRIVTGKKAIDFSEEPGGITIFFDDGSKEQGSAAIIADGIHSGLRKKLLPGVSPRYSGYTCWRGVVENRWNIQHHAVETWGSKGRFGYVPIGNNKVYWFACKNAPIKDEMMSLFRISDLVDNFKSYTYPIPEILKDTSDADLILSDIVDLKPISQYAFNRILLLGDAAHATTPNLGQGACMAMEDALFVAEEINRQPKNIVNAFKSFEQKRVPRAQYIVNTSFRLGKLAQWENPVLTKFRNMLFRLIPDWVNEKQVARVLEI